MKLLKKEYTFLLFVIILVFSSFMSFTRIPFVIMKSIQMMTIIAIMAFLFFSNFFLNIKKELFIKRYVWLFMLLPWFSVIPAYFSHGQTPIQSAMVLAVETGVFFVYFLFVKLNVSEKQLIVSLTIFSFIYTFFELFQQLTFPTYWFAGREESERTGLLEVRQGLYKFYMTGIHILTLPIFFYWESIMKKVKAERIFVFTILLIGQYAFLARKLVLALAASMIFSLFLGKKVKWYYWVLFIFIGVIVYVNLDVWFGEYIARTLADVEKGEDWSRMQSLIFYLNYFDDTLCLIFGNGRESGNSAYGEYIRGLSDMFALRRGDIGIFAHFSFYGVIGLIPIILFVVFLVKKWRFIPLYIKLYFIYHLIQTTIAFPLNSINGAFVFAIVMYLTELNIREKILESRTRNISGSDSHLEVGLQVVNKGLSS